MLNEKGYKTYERRVKAVCSIKKRYTTNEGRAEAVC